jgi:hypothetical protein
VTAATQTALYVYGVTWAGRGRVRRDGVRDAAVKAVEHGELAAIVSDVGAEPLRAKRRDLLRHSDVLQDAFAHAPVLPFRFGTVLESEDAVVDELLAARYEELVALLQRFDGLSELRVRATFVHDAILAEIVRDDHRIAALREATRDARASDTRHVQLGEAVAGSLAAKRAVAADEVVGSLVAHAQQVHVDEPRDELEVARASFLVDERGARAVERAAEQLAARNAGRFALELVGPMPPHSFVSLGSGAGR